MRCPFCGCLEDRVVDSRQAEDGASIRRRRECLTCGRRFTTYEEVEEKPLMVIKHDGRREPFSRDKLNAGIRRACEKRPVSTGDIETLARQLAGELRIKYEKEVPSLEIGRLVMARLRRLDPVAYVRFASVYRNFKDVDEFEKEIARLRKSARSRCKS